MTVKTKAAHIYIRTLKSIADVGLDMFPPRPFHFKNDAEKLFAAEQRVTSALQELVASLEQLENSY